jgi:hypothetical protein
MQRRPTLETVLARGLVVGPSRWATPVSTSKETLSQSFKQPPKKTDTKSIVRFRVEGLWRGTLLRGGDDLHLLPAEDEALLHGGDALFFFHALFYFGDLGRMS